jgi:uncharacterized protein YycO
MKPGDVLLFHGSNLIARLIQFGAHSFWNHGAIYAGEAWGQPFVFEAAFQGVRAFPLQMYRYDETLVLRPAEDVGSAAVHEAVKYLGRWYDFESYPALFLKALKSRFPWLPYRVRGNANPLFYCFELVAAAYKDAGYALTDSQLVLPQYLIEALDEGRLRLVSGTVRR